MRLEDFQPDQRRSIASRVVPLPSSESAPRTCPSYQDGGRSSPRPRALAFLPGRFSGARSTAPGANGANIAGGLSLGAVQQVIWAQFLASLLNQIPAGGSDSQRIWG